LDRNSIRIRKSRIGICLSAVLLVVAGQAGPIAVVAQEPPSPASQPSQGLLGPVYADGSFGFSVQPPAGCTTYREKQVSDDVEVVRFENLAAQQSLSVRLSTTTRPLDAQTIVEGLTANLSKQHRGQDFKMLKGEPARIASRDGVRYENSFKLDDKEWLRQEAVIPYEQNEYFTLVFITTMADRAAAEPLFDKIMASFQILRDERTRARIQSAVDRGIKLLHRTAAGELDITANMVEDSYVRCLLNGQEIGVVHVNERLTTMDNRKGIEIRQWGWLFNPDGSITHLQHDMFLATDLSFERWEDRLYVLPATQGNTPRQLMVQAENAIREQDQLGVAYLPKPNAIEKRDKLITVEKAYASAAWNVLFPRLVDLSKPELYAFSSYNSERKGLVLRTLEVVGPTHVLIDGQQLQAFKIEDSEGLIPPKSETYVDRSGRLLRVVAGNLEMVATTAKYIEQHYGRKTAEAEDLFLKLQPKPPAPMDPKAQPNRDPSPAGPPGAQPGPFGTQPPRTPRRNRQ
jgi:hypothetical protein